MSRYATQLGLGLIGLGKPWGHAPRPVPSETEARALLEFAYELGVRYFDTAPSYGDGISEARLGQYLQSMAAGQRATAVIATKMGEHWDSVQEQPYADHSFDALRRSLDQSMERLGRIDVLQLHKTTPGALKSAAVERAWEYARSLGIPWMGPSASDVASAQAALQDSRLSVLQAPYNSTHTAFGPVIDAAVELGVWVAVNRPFAMGALVAGGVDKRAAFEFARARRPAVVLTGTVSRDHLRENWEAFHHSAGRKE